MTSSQISDQIGCAVSEIRTLRPAYSGILDFYEAIFIAQKESEARITLDPISIPEPMLSHKLREKFPMIGKAEFRTDYPATEALFGKLIDISKRSNQQLAASGENILNAAAIGKISLKSLSEALLNERHAYLKKVSDTFDIELQMLVFLIHNSLKPSLLLCAEQLSSYLSNDSEWEKGYCPICGNLPCLSFFKENGARFMLCGFCDYQWQSLRIFCPFCENKDTRTLEYFYSEEEREYRTDICHKCKRYIKTVDTRRMRRFFYPRLEEIATLHLDIQAKESNFIQLCSV